VRVPGLGGWAEDPLWGSVYDWTVEHPRAGRVLWAAAVQSDLGRLYAATAEIGRQRAGARVLDVPCGGGVATRALREGQGVEYVAVDISERMLERTRRVAAEQGVADQVTTRLADVEALPFEDGAFDLVVSFTGLHCFPDPARAVVELARVTRLGGVLTGSALLNDTGLRYEPLRRVGRAAGLLGPGCTSDQLERWLARQGVDDLTLGTSGPFCYFRGVRRA
jgi:SAM-dependent methyltransferase